MIARPRSPVVAMQIGFYRTMLVGRHRRRKRAYKVTTEVCPDRTGRVRLVVPCGEGDRRRGTRPRDLAAGLEVGVGSRFEPRLGPPRTRETIMYPRSAMRTAWACAMLALSLTGASACQEPDPALAEALEVVTPALLKSHVRFLSDDLLRGRDTNDRGFEIAKEYVASQFGRMGLVPFDGSSYLQAFDLLEAVADLGSELRVADLRLREPDVRFEPDWFEGSASWTGEGVYVGYGLATHGRDDYAGADVSGKAVFLLRGEPDDWYSDRNKARASNAAVEIAIRRGASVVIQLSTPRDPAAVRTLPPPGNPRRVLALADGTSPRVRAHATVADGGSWRLLEAWGVNPGEAITVADVGESPGLPVGQVSLTRTHRLEPVRSWNVVGIVPGADPEQREESIVFTAHLDHVGIGPPNSEGDSINNGAHDNAIGTAKLMASAEAMVRLQPRRSIVFAAVGAEERGLLGSWHYVRNPAFPIESVVANINQDGGREGVPTEDVIDNAADLSDMGRIVRAVLAEVGVGVMDRDRALTSPVGFSSDHYPFLLAGVPAIDLKPGHTVAGDWQIGLADRLKYYDEWRHRPADNFNEQTFTMESTAEMAKRAVLLAWHLSEMEGMPAMDPEHPIYRERAMPSEPYYFGPDYRFGR